MIRKKLIAGNWKMYKTAQQAREFVQAFLPLVAASDTIDRVSRWVITRAIRDCREWRDAGSDVGVSVNLSPYIGTRKAPSPASVPPPCSSPRA